VALEETDLSEDPIAQFLRWFSDARAARELEPEAMALATSTPEGHPSVRFVLLRGVDQRGFVFYTNGRSPKAQEMGATGWAGLAFRWERSERQVRVSGRVGPVGADESDAYFAGRDRGSQIGAWASDQSQPVAGRDGLDRRVREVTERFEGRSVPRPPWWGGFRVVPEEVEFWQQGAFRLHDRFRYVRKAGGEWSRERLFP